MRDNRTTVMRPEQNAEYISKIRMRLCDDQLARKEREKRRRRVLVEQLAAHEAIEQSKHEDMLVTCLMRQSQLERRIALQLLQVRLEKDTIRNNRLQREQQYMQRRLKDFDEALNHEGEVARLTKVQYEEQYAKEVERHEAIATQNANTKYTKHYKMCKDTLMEMVDFACLAGHYKDLSEQPIPVQMWREWKALFVAGKPFYSFTGDEPNLPEADEEAVMVLNQCNMDQYASLEGEWAPPDNHPDIASHLPHTNNFILGHILSRLENIVYPPSAPATPPQFPEFPVKAAVIGKTFAGKTSVLHALAAKKRLRILDVDELVEQAVEAFNCNETVEITEIEEVNEESIPSEEKSGAEAVKTGDSATVPPPEKPAEEGLSGVVTPALTLRTVTKQVPSPRALLGKAAEAAMTKGKIVPTQILVEVVTLNIREVPEGTGWILDNFPKTLKQAKALEKALSGFSESRTSMVSTPATARSTRNTPSPSKAMKNGKKGKKNQLVEEPDCDKPTPPPAPISGLDLVIHLTLPDKVAMKRACGRRKHKDGQEYHEENRPPPEGSYTGVPPTYQEFTVKHSRKVQSPTLKQHFSSKSADTEFGSVDPDHPSTPTTFLQEIPSQPYDMPTQLVTFQEEWPRMEKWFLMFNNLESVDAQLPLSNVEENVEDLLREALEKPAVPAAAETPVAAESTPDPAQPTPPAQTTTDGGEEGAAAPEGIPDTIPEEPPRPPTPAPGTGEWAYVDEPIPCEVANVLYPQWELVEESYLKLCKYTFKKIRQERETIIRYFFSTKRNFVTFLERPDNKQTFVTSWVKNYNNVAEDMREDMEMKSELHQTVEDLQEQLWDISDKKKVEAEEERSIIMSEQWLEDHIGLLTNQYIQLMQAEVDRYQGSIRVIRDYYQVTERKVLDEPRKEFVRVALVDIPRTDTPQPPSVENERGSAKSERSRSAGKVQSSPSGNTPAAVPPTESEEEPEQKRIPLVPRKLPERESRKSARRETPEQDCEEAQIMEALMSALAVVDQLKQPSADDDSGDAGKGKAKGKDKGKAKKGKKSVSPAVTPNAGTPVPELTPEEIARQKMLERATAEGAVAILNEDRAFNLKINIIKLRAIAVIRGLKDRASTMYQIQQDWIGQRFQKEMDSIKSMCEMFGDVIESEKPLLPQVYLLEDKFTVDLGYKMFEPAVTPPPDAPIEMPSPDIFTIEQLTELERSLKEVAPSGYVTVDLLVEMFTPPSNLPELWQSAPSQLLEELFSSQVCEGKYVNWKHVLLSCLLPLPLPTQNLLISVTKQFRLIDSANSGFIDIGQYAQGNMWFSGEPGDKFDRLSHLKTTLFTLFCDESFKIDYTNFLLLFCSDPEPTTGVLKALSVMTGHEVEWPQYIETPDPSKEGDENSDSGAVRGVPTGTIPITLEQLLRVVSFLRLPTQALSLLTEEATKVYKEIQNEDGVADVNTLLMHPRGKEIIANTSAFRLVDYSAALIEGLEGKIAERAAQPLA